MINLENYRTDGRINIDEIEKENPNKMIELLGARKKCWLLNKKYLYKEIYPNTYEDYAEVIAAEIAGYLELEHAEYDFAVSKGNYGVVTKNFLNEEAGEILITGKEIIRDVLLNYIKPISYACNDYKKLKEKNNIEQMTLEEKNQYIRTLNNMTKIYGINNRQQDLIEKYIEHADRLNSQPLADEMIQGYDNLFEMLEYTYADFFENYDQIMDQEKVNANGIVNNLFDLWSIIDIYIKKNKLGTTEDCVRLNNSLFELFIFDLLTLQGDRHSENWSVIVNKKENTIRLAPLFDNSNIFNLNRSKAITTLSDLTQRLANPKLQSGKRDRMEKQLKKALYHPSTLLSVYGESGKYLEQAETFINLYSREDLQYLKEKIESLDENTMSFIFAKIESSSKIKIPNEVKEIVSQSIKTNGEEILKIMTEKKGEYLDEKQI